MTIRRITQVGRYYNRTFQGWTSVRAYLISLPSGREMRILCRSNELPSWSNLATHKYFEL